jgi:hypothetical protein
MPAPSTVQALGLILHGPPNQANPEMVGANANIVLLDYRDPATFSALWLKGLKSEKWKRKLEGTEKEETIDVTDSSKQFLIIGNDPPDSIFDTKIPSLAGINFRAHFTATSWLAAFKVKFSPKEEEKMQKAKESLAQIAVIDPRKAGMASGVGRALQTIFAARDPDDRPLIPGSTVLNTPSLEGICQWLKPANSDTRTLAKDAPHLRELLKSTIWNELISNREQHHALSNVLGPMILSGKEIGEKCFDLAKSEEQDDNQEQQSTASNRVSLLLRSLLSACGLVSWEDMDADDKKSQPSEAAKDLQIVLLDDQAKQGWEDWIKECLPEAAGTMEVTVDPTALVEAISQALEPVKDADGTITGYNNKDARFRLEIPALNAATHPVLLLDLRLFSGKPDAEKKFLRDKLLPLVNHFTNKTDLAWPEFSSTIADSLFNRAKDLVEAKNGKQLIIDTDEHHEVLTWLPRVVALADMSLPIILFSSTGRRDLIEPFKPYGNIITIFEKPRLIDLATTGEGNKTHGVREGTASALRDSLAKARSWLVFRKAVAVALQSHRESPQTFPEIDGIKMEHFEIYFDESGSARDDGFRVAAVIAGYQSMDHAKLVAEEMHKAGTSWFNEDGNPVIYDKSQRLPNELSKWSCQFGKHLDPLWMIPVVLWSDPKADQTSSDAINADTLIQTLVGDLLEMALFVLLPKQPGVTYAVYGAQRRIEIKGSAFESTVNIPGKDASASVDADWLRRHHVEVPEESTNAVANFREKWAVGDGDIVYDVHRKGGRAMFLSIRSGHDYASILAKAFQSRPWEDPWKSQAGGIRVRFSPLNHPKEAKLSNGDRPIHILSDLLPGDATWAQANGFTLNATQGFFSGPAHQPPVLVAQGEEFGRLMGACRAMDGGDYALALAQFSLLDGMFRSHAGPLYDAAEMTIATGMDKIMGQHLVGALHHRSLQQAGSLHRRPYSRVHIRHQHWTRYPRPAPEDLKALGEYAGERLVIDFGMATTELELGFAKWLANKAMTDIFQTYPINGVELFEESATLNLFAVVHIGSSHNGVPFRQWVIKAPPTLSNRTPIKMTLGGVPIGRLERINSLIEWIDAKPAAMHSKGWTVEQIEAVLDLNQRRKLKPIPLTDAVKATACITASPHWYQNNNGDVVLFVSDADLEGASKTLGRDLAVAHLSPEDFDTAGHLLHSQNGWPQASLPSGPLSSSKKPRLSAHAANVTSALVRLPSDSVNSRPAFNHLAKWRVKPYPGETEYRISKATWHTLGEAKGFYVRKANNPKNHKITVYADMDIVDAVLLDDFTIPQANQLNEKGRPRGIPWSPDLQSNPHHDPHTCAQSSPNLVQSTSPHKPQAHKAWIGPVPMGINSTSLCNSVKENLPGWEPEKEWVKDVKENWWLPISRKIDQDACILPVRAKFAGLLMNITPKNPELR